MKNILHKKRTLMAKSKEGLVDHIICLEHNNAAMAESFEIQYQNCMKMIDDMNLLNDTLKYARKLDNEKSAPGRQSEERKTK